MKSFINKEVWFIDKYGKPCKSFIYAESEVVVYCNSGGETENVCITQTFESKDELLEHVRKIEEKIIAKGE